MSSIYCAVIISGTAQKQAEATIREKYPDSHELITGVFLISTDESAGEVAAAIGVKPEEEGEAPRLGEGIVMRINGSYAGYADSSLGTWLRAYA